MIAIILILSAVIVLPFLLFQYHQFKTTKKTVDRINYELTQHGCFIYKNHSNLMRKSKEWKLKGSIKQVTDKYCKDNNIQNTKIVFWVSSRLFGKTGYTRCEQIKTCAEKIQSYKYNVTGGISIFKKTPLNELPYIWFFNTTIFD